MARQPEDLERTRQSLLVRLKNWQDHASWQDFFNKYWRLIYSVARRSGLSEDDAQEVAQETIIGVSKGIQSFEYRPQSGSFRAWLLKLTRQRLIQRWRKQKTRPGYEPMFKAEALAAKSSVVNSTPTLDAIWEEEWERNLVEAAKEQVRKQVNGKQFQIYDLYVLQDWPVGRVKDFLKVSTSQVYLAKHRVGRLMKMAVHAIERCGKAT